MFLFTLFVSRSVERTFYRYHLKKRNMAKQEKYSLGILFRIIPIVLGIIGLGMFIMTVFSDYKPPLQSLYWLLLVIGALILPYIKEITFGDLQITLREGLEKQQKELEETREGLEKKIDESVSSALDRVRKVDQEFGKIRDELIKGYQIYLMEYLKSESERSQKVHMLNRMYWTELQLSITYLKTMLTKAGFYQGAIDDTYSKELVQAIKAFQEAKEMVPDGVFGHNSLRNLEASVME